MEQDPYREKRKRLNGVGLVITILGISLVITSVNHYTWQIIAAIGVILVGFLFNIAATLRYDKL